MTAARQLLDAFERERWTSRPYEQMLEIAHRDSGELLDLVLLSIDRLGQSETFVDGALSFLGEAQFATAVERAVSFLQSRPESVTGDSPAEAVIVSASLQFSSLLAEHLPRLWALAPNRSSYYSEWPWRAARRAERERLLRLLRDEPASRERAWFGILETRVPAAIARALAIATGSGPFLNARRPAGSRSSATCWTTRGFAARRPRRASTSRCPGPFSDHAGTAPRTSTRRTT